MKVQRCYFLLSYISRRLKCFSNSFEKIPLIFFTCENNSGRLVNSLTCKYPHAKCACTTLANAPIILSDNETIISGNIIIFRN